MKDEKRKNPLNFHKSYFIHKNKEEKNQMKLK